LSDFIFNILYQNILSRKSRIIDIEHYDIRRLMITLSNIQKDLNNISLHASMGSDCDKFIEYDLSRAASGRATLSRECDLLETGASRERDFEGIARSRECHISAVCHWRFRFLRSRIVMSTLQKVESDRIDVTNRWQQANIFINSVDLSRSYRFPCSREFSAGESRRRRGPTAHVEGPSTGPTSRIVLWEFYRCAPCPRRSRRVPIVELYRRANCEPLFDVARCTRYRRCARLVKRRIFEEGAPRSCCRKIPRITTGCEQGPDKGFFLSRALLRATMRGSHDQRWIQLTLEKSAINIIFRTVTLRKQTIFEKYYDF